MRDLLLSRSGHRTLVLLIKIIGNSRNYGDQEIVVGSVSIVTVALWGSQVTFFMLFFISITVTVLLS